MLVPRNLSASSLQSTKEASGFWHQGQLLVLGKYGICVAAWSPTAWRRPSMSSASIWEPSSQGPISSGFRVVGIQLWRPSGPIDPSYALRVPSAAMNSITFSVSSRFALLQRALFAALLGTSPVALLAQCTTTNATSCQCRTSGQTNCDLLPD